jgi:ferritin-like metal-binding protein YciE
VFHRAPDGKGVMPDSHLNTPAKTVDRRSLPVIDPTANVLALSEASNKRQDDLRDAIVHRIDTELSHQRDYFKDILEAHDKRYEQRYEASQKALEAALVAQKDAVKEAFAAQKEAINAALASADRAVSKAEIASEKRFEGVNEFRAQLGDQQRTLMPRAEAEKITAVMAEKLTILESFRTQVLSTGTGAKEGYGWAIGVVSLVLVVLSIISAAIVLLTRVGLGK